MELELGSNSISILVVFFFLTLSQEKTFPHPKRIFWWIILTRNINSEYPINFFLKTLLGLGLFLFDFLLFCWKQIDIWSFYLRWKFFFSQPRRPVSIAISFLSAGDAQLWTRGIRSGVRVLPRHIWSLRHHSNPFTEDCARLVLQGLGTGHGARVGFHWNQVSHLWGTGLERNSE